MKPAAPLRVHRVHNIINTVFEIFRARCFKYYEDREHKNNAIRG